MTSGKKKKFKFKKKISPVNAMQIAREAIRLTFKHWPPSERLTRQPYCLSINLHLITHKAPLAGGNLLGNTPQRRGGWGQYGDVCLHGLRVPGQLPGCCWEAQAVSSLGLAPSRGLLGLQPCLEALRA